MSNKKRYKISKIQIFLVIKMAGKRGKIKGYYSKVNRHARAMAKCRTCAADAGKILMKRRRTSGAKNSTRYPGRSAMAGLRGLINTYPGKDTTGRRKRKPRTPEQLAATLALRRSRKVAKAAGTPTAADMMAPW